MDLNGARILIVEDEALIVFEVAAMVKAMGGFVAGTARSVADAREAITMPGLDCVLLDLSLGDVMAFEIARELQNKGLPFFFLTAHDTDVISGFEQVPLVRKPFNRETLARGFEAALAMRNPGEHFSAHNP